MENPMSQLSAFILKQAERFGNCMLLIASMFSVEYMYGNDNSSERIE